MSEGASLIFYILAFLSSGGLFYYGKLRKQSVFIAFALLIPMCIATFRYGVGTDYFAYVSLFHNLSSLSIMEFLQGQAPTGTEVGFFLLVKLSGLFNGTFLMFAVCAFLTVYFFYLGLKRFNIKHQTLAYVLYLLILFPATMNIMRQGVAISICFFALSFVITHQFKKYAVWVVVASLFHSTALLLIPFYFVNRLVKKEKEDVYFIFLTRLVFVAILIFLLLPYIFNLLTLIPFFEKYIKYQTISADGSNYLIYVQAVILMFVVITLKRVVPKPIRAIQLYFIIFATLEVLFTTLGFSSAFIKRSALYFSFFSPLLLTNFVDIFSDRLGRFLVRSVIIIYGIAYFYIAYYLLRQAEVIPYNTIFGGIA